MDEAIGKQILAEMKKNTRMNQFFVIVLVLIVSTGVALTKSINKKRSEQVRPSWSQVDSALKQNDYAKAMQITQTLIGSRTDDAYGEDYLGYIHYRSGDLNKAELHYARANELCPSERSEKALTSIQKALEFKNRQTPN